MNVNNGSSSSFSRRSRTSSKESRSRYSLVLSHSVSFSMRTVARRDGTSAHKHAIHQRRSTTLERCKGTSVWWKDGGGGLLSGQPTYARRQAWPHENTAHTTNDQRRRRRTITRLTAAQLPVFHGLYESIIHSSYWLTATSASQRGTRRATPSSIASSNAAVNISPPHATEERTVT